MRELSLITSVQEVATLDGTVLYQVYEKITPSKWVTWSTYHATREAAQQEIDDVSEKNR